MKKLSLIIFSILFLNTIFNTRTCANNYTYQANDGVQFEWTKGDELCAYPTSGKRIILWVHDVATDTHRTTVSGSGWQLAANNDYYLFSPYMSVHAGVDKTQLPVAYTTQKQVANDDLSHLSAYDYMYASGTTTSTSAEFSLHHFGSILRISVPVRRSGIFTSLTLSSETQCLPVDYLINVVNHTMEVQNTTDEFTLQLDSIEVSRANLVAYVMMPPVDLSNEMLTVTLRAADGREIKGVVQGCNIAAGQTYDLDLSASAVVASSAAAKAIEQSFDTSEISLTFPLVTAVDFPLDATAGFTTTTAAYLRGDANSDGHITREDAYMVIDHYLGFTTSGINLLAADANEDGVITMADANWIILRMLGKIND